MKRNVWKKRAVSCLLFLFFICFTYASACAAAPKLSAKKLEIKVGINASLKVANAGKKKVTWKTSDSGIVSIKKKSNTSVILQAGKKTGSATVTVKVAKKTLKCRVEVVNWKFSMTKGTTIAVGGTTAFKFYGVTGKNYSSSNPKVAKVSKKGKVTGLKKGTCYINFDVGRYHYTTQIKVEKKLSPDLTAGTFIFSDGGAYEYVSATAKAGKSAALDIKNSALGCYQIFYFYANGERISSGLSCSSSKPDVLSYFSMDNAIASFFSLKDGKTQLKVKYGGNTYKFTVTVSDRDSAKFSRKREAIYSSLGINSTMPKQYICYLLATWICDHTVYDPKVLDNSTSSAYGYDSTYKDYFRHGAVVCSGYADLFMYLCAGVDIPCRQVDYADGAHRWNQVQIDGIWYNVDTCWMDTAEDGVYSMYYFLVSDSAMKTFSDGRHRDSPKFLCTDTRFDGCLQEQLAQQEQNDLDYSRPWSQYAYLNPWATGSWTKY